MQHSIPTISEVSLEIKSIEYYHNGLDSLEDISVELDVKTIFNEDNSIVFFIHVRYFLEFEDDDHESVFHTDYLSFIECKDVEWKGVGSIEVDKNHLAHLLGMSFLMVRGSISHQLSSNILSKVEIPIISPIKMLEENLESDEKYFTVTSEFQAH